MRIELKNAIESTQLADVYTFEGKGASAIQAHFSGDIEKCVEYLEEALNLAKETNQPTWIIKDILVDLRNEHWVCCTARNEFSDAPAQKELTESNEELYYPILDRIDESLHEKYIEGLYKKKTESPYSVALGNNLDQYGEMLASSFIVSMYNGSLTHILLIYEKIRNSVLRCWRSFHIGTEIFL